MKDINKINFNEINTMIINKIKIELEKDLSPSELNSIARLALAFQKEIKDEVVDEQVDKRSREGFEKAMSLLDQIEHFRLANPGFEFK
jgi:hypothetical protein|tara:strand:+ start:70 stop:333 length:264 start_codon:yes stop_codon:yes gene_type:complete